MLFIGGEVSILLSLVQHLISSATAVAQRNIPMEEWARPSLEPVLYFASYKRLRFFQKPGEPDRLHVLKSQTLPRSRPVQTGKRLGQALRLLGREHEEFCRADVGDEGGKDHVGNDGSTA